MSMAARRPSVCLFCQARQSSIGRRKASSTARRRLEAAVALRPTDDGVLLQSGRQEIFRGRTKESERTRKEKEGQSLHSEQEEESFRQARLEFEVLHKQRDVRLEVLRNLSNPWPEWNENNRPMNGHNSGEAKKPPSPPEAAAAPVPHSTFQKMLKEAQGHKAVRLILRSQLLRCEMPRDVMRILATAMQSAYISSNLAALVEPIIRSMYRCRNNVSDPEVLRTIKTIATRFNMAGLDYSPHLLIVGLKFAARSRSLRAMKWFLREIRSRGKGMSSNIFRSVIAKFSIGHRGLGEIRNGRWRREELMQVLAGFPDCAHLPPEQQYHLGSFMERDDWQYLHGWVAVLARCRDADGVWREWEMWRTSPARSRPKGLNGQRTGMTTKLRGDYWFVEQMTYTKDLWRAWRLLEETGLRFKTLKTRVKVMLLEGVEHAGGAWNEEVREAMVWKYDLELSKIERALGVTWDTTSSSHVLIPGQSQEESLEKLATQDFRLEEEYGFPYDGHDEDDAPIVESRERELHAAEECAEDDDSASGVPWIGIGRPRVWQYAGRGVGAMNEEQLEVARKKSAAGRSYVEG